METDEIFKNDLSENEYTESINIIDSRLKKQENDNRCLEILCCIIS